MSSYRLSIPGVALIASLAAAACGGDTEPEHGEDVGVDAPVDADAGADASDVGEDADVEETRSCADFLTLEVCVGGACEERACRGDEVCQQDACVPWTEAELSADFTLTQSPDAPTDFAVEVAPGGFPRAQAEAIRFTFGDGVAGWGESLTHAYDGPGVYPVELEVRLEGFRVLRASAVAVVTPGEDHEPLMLTVNAIPGYMNGASPVTLDSGTPSDPIDDVEVAIRHQVARDRFTIDVELREDPADPLEAGSLALTADVDFGDVPAGGDLSGLLVFEEGERIRTRRARLELSLIHI